MKIILQGGDIERTKYTNSRINIVLNDKGKPSERMGRKADGLKTFESMAAGLPNFG